MDRYKVFAGAWYQGNCIIVAQNDWIGSAINIRQNSKKNKTKLEVKRTIPHLRTLAMMFIVIAFSTTAVIASIKNHFYPTYITGGYLLATLTASQYYGQKERLAVMEIAGFLTISNYLISSEK